MSKDVWIAGVIIASCLGLFITAMFLPKKETNSERDQHIKSDYSIKQAGNVYVIIDHKCKVTHTLIFNPDTKIVNIALGEKLDD
jgi:hypothetical protein